MGIRSKNLYEQLTKIVVDKDLSIFKDLPSTALLPELCYHFSNTIPLEVFNQLQSNRNLVARLQELSKYIDERFTKKDKYPFTIQRICELSYHPLKYFQINDLNKFVYAMEKCCNVDTEWSATLGEENNDTDLMEDVSLVPIDWAKSDEKTQKTLPLLLYQIETIVAVNFGYDDDLEDDNEDARDDDIGHRYSKDGDILIEEYENEDDETEDDDYEENDDNFDDESTSSDISDDESVETNSPDESKQEKGTSSIEHAAVKTENNVEENFVSNSHDQNDAGLSDDSESSRKRNVTEIDDYKYNDSQGAGSITTPKKSKMLLHEYNSTIVSPVISNEDRVRAKKAPHSSETISSPRTISSNPNEGSEASTSPLQNKTRM